MAELTRTLQKGMAGKDVEACKRMVYRYLDDGSSWQAFVRQTPVVRRFFGPYFQTSVKKAQAALGIAQSGAIGPRTFDALVEAGAMDATAAKLLNEYEYEHQIHLCYPHPDVPRVYVGQGLHPTAGIPGSWAVDFMAPGGTPVLSSCDAVVIRFSGHDPATGVHGRAGDVFGWSMYTQDERGREYYLTHMGTRTVRIGQKLKTGQQIGTVGHWPHDPGRSHTHEGVKSPHAVGGTADAKRRILEIASAPKLPPL